MIPIDEQIKYQQICVDTLAKCRLDVTQDKAILASLQRLKAIDAVQVPEIKYAAHLECGDAWYSCPKSEDGCLDHGQGDECTCGADDYNRQLDTLRDLLKRESADKAILTAAYESKKTLLESCEIALCAAEASLAQARKEGRLAGMREAAEICKEMHDMGHVDVCNTALTCATAITRAAEGK